MLYAIGSLAVLGGIFGFLLGYANKKFAVEKDPRIVAIEKALPGANCGACGFAGCSNYAEAIVKEKAAISCCTVANADTLQKIARIMGLSVMPGSGGKQVAQLMCCGGTDKAELKYHYIGIKDCYLAATQYGGPKLCSYGCIGLGSCVSICPFNAIKMGPDELPEIDRGRCTGCGICVEYCPQKVLKLVNIEQLVLVRCSSKETGKKAKDACQTACISCGLCERNCPEKAIHVVKDIEGSIAVIDYEKCTGCGMCVEICPTKAIEMMSPVINSENCGSCDGR